MDGLGKVSEGGMPLTGLIDLTSGGCSVEKVRVAGKVLDFIPAILCLPTL